MQTIGSIHIVRKFGLVGGMENYVWHLTNELSRLGHPVIVLCEARLTPSDPAIEIIELGQHFAKPRWLSMLKFSTKVEQQLSRMDTQQYVIHSHERCRSHHITTFHGPPIVCRKKSFLDLLSARLKTWEYLEERELNAPHLRYIVPNSALIQQQLASYYPFCSTKIASPIFPGVDTINSKKHDDDKKIDKNPDRYTVGFIGKEWKRKGLVFATKTVAQLRQKNPDIHFLVAGCPQNEVEFLFKDWSTGYSLLQWTEPKKFYPKIDLLIHPATIEPFGMVIAEANQHNVPVLISDQCGIANLITAQQGKVLPLSAEAQWVTSAQQLLSNPSPIISLGLTWQKCAQQYLLLYKKILRQE